MTGNIILASGSQVRATLLRAAGVPIRVVVPKMDEASLRNALVSEGMHPRDVADALAEGKARKVGLREANCTVIGADQVLVHDGKLLSKPSTREAAREQLELLAGGTHVLITAAVIYQSGLPVWRHVNEVEVTMRKVGKSYLDDYILRNWESIQHSLGGYKLEEEGVRLISRIAGDHFSVLGLPLIEVLTYLTLKGELPG